MTGLQDPKGVTRTISLFVRDEPGVLVRIALVFSRRGYNIESLVVSASAQPGYSRMTISCCGDRDAFPQITKQLGKLIDVVHVLDHTDEDAVEAEIALIKIRCPLAERTPILQLCHDFKARVVDASMDGIVLRVAGRSAKITALIRILAEFELEELVRSGPILMARGVALT